METIDLGNKGKGKKGLITKTWERYRSFRGGKKLSLTTKNKSWPGILPLPKSKSWHIHRRVDSSSSLVVVDHEDKDEQGHKHHDKSTSHRGRVTPAGCFSVYVGPERQRFVMRTEYANHPLFKMLLEEAETEYGYQSGGPLTLPCNVDMFYRILSEMEMDGDDEEQVRPSGCNFAKGFGSSYRLLSPSRMVAMEY